MYKKFIDYFQIRKEVAIDKGNVESFIRAFGELQLKSGMFSVFNYSESLAWTEQIRSVFPENKKTYTLFGVDWLGRCFGVTTKTIGKDVIFIFDPRNLEVCRVQCNFSDFINEELPSNHEKYLLSRTFEQWKKLTDVEIPKMHCVGYKVPIFLGGKGTMENLEVIDLDVYWDITAQLKEAIANMEEGTVIEGFTIE